MTSSMEEYLQREDPWQQEQPSAPKPVHISLSLIAKRNLLAEIAEGSHDKLIESIMKLTHVRLDREHIMDIDNLEMLGPVTNLYLQQNQITRIENLESLLTLRFMTLAGNQIEKVENLHLLDELKFLDLSDNKIESFDPEAFTKSLKILNLEDNPCTRHVGYRSSLLRALPNLQQLDNIDITRQEQLLAGCEVSDDSSGSEEEDEDDDEEEGEDIMEQPLVFRASGDDVLQLSTDYIRESQARQRDHLAAHQIRMDEIEELRAESQLAMNTGRSSVRDNTSPRSDGSASHLSR